MRIVGEKREAKNFKLKKRTFEIIQLCDNYYYYYFYNLKLLDYNPTRLPLRVHLIIKKKKKNKNIKMKKQELNYNKD